MNPNDARIILCKTIERIVARSRVAWDVGCEGLALALTPEGYVLTTGPERYRDALPARARISKEDGAPMPHRHLLTLHEREAAVLAILQAWTAQRQLKRNPHNDFALRRRDVRPAK